jgi:DNA-binding MarR family transcriptional regulator
MPKALYTPPLTISRPELLSADGRDDREFRGTLYLMVLAFSRLQACREAFGREIGLTGSQYAVLIGTAYCQAGSGVSIRALAEHVRLAATHVTTEVNRLVRRRLLDKRPNPLDRRSVQVSLTRDGEQRIDALAPYLRQVNDLLFAGMGRDDMTALERCLRRFAANGERALAAIAGHEAATAPPRQRAPAPQRRRAR